MPVLKSLTIPAADVRSGDVLVRKSGAVTVSTVQRQRTRMHFTTVVDGDPTFDTVAINAAKEVDVRRLVRTDDEVAADKRHSTTLMLLDKMQRALDTLHSRRRRLVDLVPPDDRALDILRDAVDLAEAEAVWNCWATVFVNMEHDAREAAEDGALFVLDPALIIESTKAVRDEITQEVVRQAEYGVHSSSAVHNLADEATLRGLASFVADLRYVFGR